MKASPAVDLLLTNLRLLDYPTDPSSFPLTPDVFTSLTNKGRAFEHIIHHLLYTYDPTESELRFRGIWPVFEPAQARALRNTVFAWLEELKRAGKLPGVLVRRTTLDDCAGQRYEELLLALSTMVLRSRVERRGFKNVNYTQVYRQATSTVPDPRKLTVLNLAHQSAIRRVLIDRANSKQQWGELSRVLDRKEAALKEVDCGEEVEVKVGRGYEEGIRRKWRDNWMGDQRWLELLLEGDPEAMRDPVLEVPFDVAVREGERLDRGRDGGLRELERKVRGQQERVRAMRGLREMVGGGGGSPRKDAIRGKERRGLKVEFKGHKELNLRNVKVVKTGPRAQRNEYTEMLDSLRELLMDASGPRTREPRERLEFASFRQEDSINVDVSMNMDPTMDHESSPLQYPTDKPNMDIYGLGIDLDGSPALDQASGSDISMEDMLSLMDTSSPSPLKRSSRGYSYEDEPIRTSQSYEDAPIRAPQSYEDEPIRKSRNSYEDAPIRTSQHYSDAPLKPSPPSYLDAPIKTYHPSPASSDRMDVDTCSDSDISEIMIPTSATTLSPSEPVVPGFFYREPADPNRRQSKPQLDPHERDPFNRRRSHLPPSESPIRRDSQLVGQDDTPRRRQSQLRADDPDPFRRSSHRQALAYDDPSPSEPRRRESALSSQYDDTSRRSSSHLPSSFLPSPQEDPFRPHPAGQTSPPYLRRQSTLNPPAQHHPDPEDIATRIVSHIASTSFSPDKPSPTKPSLPQQHLAPAFDFDDSYDESFSLPQATPSRLQTPSMRETPKEDLLVSEDYNSVFKSRPKIAVSPPFSPVGGLGSVEESPLRRKGR